MLLFKGRWYVDGNETEDIDNNDDLHIYITPEDGKIEFILENVDAANGYNFCVGIFLYEAKPIPANRIGGGFVTIAGGEAIYISTDVFTAGSNYSVYFFVDLNDSGTDFPNTSDKTGDGDFDWYVDGNVAYGINYDEDLIDYE